MALLLLRMSVKKNLWLTAKQQNNLYVANLAGLAESFIGSRVRDANCTFIKTGKEG